MVADRIDRLDAEGLLVQKIRNFLSALFRPSPRADRLERLPSPPPRSPTRYELESKLGELVQYRIWDWERFRGVLICLGMMGAGRYVPAPRRPDRVLLDGLQPTFRELRRISALRSGRETSRVVFVDRERACLVISGRTHVGSSSGVGLGPAPEPGREAVQTPILTIHVHPDQGGDAGMSESDYLSFLCDPRQIVMAICCQGGILLAIKTTATRKDVSPDAALRQVSASLKDISSIWSRLHLSNPLLAISKAVCLEYGMTLYQTKDLTQNQARRIGVTRF